MEYNALLATIRRKISDGCYSLETFTVETDDYGEYIDNRYIAESSNKTDNYYHDLLLQNNDDIIEVNDIIYDVLNEEVNRYKPRLERHHRYSDEQILIWDREGDNYNYYIKCCIAPNRKDAQVVIHLQDQLR